MKRRALAVMLSLVLGLSYTPCYANTVDAAESQAEELAPEEAATEISSEEAITESAAEEVAEEVANESATEEEAAMAGSCGKNVTYEIVPKADGTNKLVISGNGYIDDYSYDGGPWCGDMTITEVVIEAGIRYIGSNAFRDLMKLRSVSLPEGLITIENMAFDHCSELCEINFPDSLTVISEGAFSECGFTSFTFPKNMTYIHENILAYNDKLTNIIIPEGVRRIETAAFLGCYGLQQITIPKSLRYIGEMVFSGYGSDFEDLTDVYYGGTEDDWNRINIEAYGNNALKNATIHFTEIPENACGNNATYEMIGNMEEGYEIVISGTGDMYDFEYDAYVSGSWYEGDYIIPWLEYRPYITKVTINDGITGIGKWCFGRMESLTEVVLPDSVTRIGRAAFESCQIKELDLPDNLKEIDDYAFNANRVIETLSIPGSVTTIGYLAFGYCPNLKTVTYENGITDINGDAFDDCSSLKTVYIPESVKSIESYSFESCPLEEVYYSGTKEDWDKIKIGKDCRKLLRAYYLGNGIEVPVEEITGSCGEDVNYVLSGNVIDGYEMTISGTGDMYDFNYDFDLQTATKPWEDYQYLITKVTVEDGVTSIGDESFNYFTNILSVELPNSITRIGEQAFHWCENLTEIKIPAGVTSIERMAFSGCKKVTEFTIPSGITTIEEDSFAYCYGLTALVIPEGVTTIEDWAFGSCTGLKTVTIPNSVTEIGEYVFYDAPITDIYYTGDRRAWDSINIAEFGNWDISKATYHFNYVYPPVCVITEQPENAIVEAGEKAAFHVTASRAKNYTWQYSKDGSTWKTSTVSSASTDTLTMKASATNAGNLYRCMLTGEDGKVVYTDTVKLAVVKKPVITEQPTDVTAATGTKISFHVTVENAISYQWQYSKDGITWKNSTITSASTDTVSLTVSDSNKSNVYRCKITGEEGIEIYSDIVGITVIPPVEITAQPQIAVAPIGQQITYTVEAENVAEAGYQWYYSKDGVKWSKSSASSAATASLTLKLSSTNRTNLYRCTITGLDGKKVNSEVCGAVAVSSQPVSVAVDTDKSASFTVAAEGIISYQWYYSKDLVKWSKSTISSATTEKLTVKASDTTRQNYYRCELTTDNGLVVYTDVVRLLESCIEITTQPADVTAAVGNKISFSVAAEGVASYQWQYSKDGSSWKNSTITSASTDTVKLTVSDSNKTNMYRCKLTGTDGSVKYTNTVAIG